MTAIEVPLIADGLQASLKRVIDDKRLGDDIFWRTHVRPAVSQRITDIKHRIEASQPQEKELVASLDYIQNRLEGAFLQGAPFTIHRLAELILYYRDSGYSLSTTQRAAKYIDALKKVVLVLSRETEFGETSSDEHTGRKLVAAGSSFNATSLDNQDRGLPTNVPFVEITWDVPDGEQSTKDTTKGEDKVNMPEDGDLSEFDDPHAPASKRLKVETTEDDSPNGGTTLLSPLPDTKSLGPETKSLGPETMAEVDGFEAAGKRKLLF